jgi:hypothetical protein
MTGTGHIRRPVLQTKMMDRCIRARDTHLGQGGNNAAKVYRFLGHKEDYSEAGFATSRYSGVRCRIYRPPGDIYTYLLDSAIRRYREGTVFTGVVKATAPFPVEIDLTTLR